MILGVLNKNLENLIKAGIEESEAKKELSILQKEIKDESRIEKIIEERIRARKPIQYILGKSYFMDFEVEVNKSVLIPRPETELLVEEAVLRVRLRPNSTIIDIGTGSGIIPIALAKRFPKSEITAIDINKEIIELAKRNACKNNVSGKINFKICDVFSDCFKGLINANNFDIIISNPPYIREDIYETLTPEVKNHEPKSALTGSKENKSGLIYYERIIEVCQANFFGFEIDPSLTTELKALLKKHSLNNYEIVKDYSKLDRFLFISRDFK